MLVIFDLLLKCQNDDLGGGFTISERLLSSAAAAASVEGEVGPKPLEGPGVWAPSQLLPELLVQHPRLLSAGP